MKTVFLINYYYQSNRISELISYKFDYHLYFWHCIKHSRMQVFSDHSEVFFLNDPLTFLWQRIISKRLSKKFMWVFQRRESLSFTWNLRNRYIVTEMLSADWRCNSDFCPNILELLFKETLNKTYNENPYHLIFWLF